MALEVGLDGLDLFGGYSVFTDLYLGVEVVGSCFEFLSLFACECHGVCSVVGGLYWCLLVGTLGNFFSGVSWWEGVISCFLGWVNFILGSVV